MRAQKTSTKNEWEARCEIKETRWQRLRRILGLKIAGFSKIAFHVRHGAAQHFVTREIQRSMRIEMPVSKPHGKVQFGANTQLTTQEIHAAIDKVTGAKSVQEEFPEFFPEQDK